MCRFVNESRRQDGKYIPLFRSNIGQFCNATAVTNEREGEKERNKLEESENMFFNLSFKIDFRIQIPAQTIYKFVAGKKNRKKNIFKISSQVIGVNALGKCMQSMFDAAGIDKKVANHSGRVYSCSTSYNRGFEEQDVVKISGYRCSAVRTYKRASEEKEREMLNALQPPSSKTQCVESE